jgi:uncharacterized protein (DUF1697 family)
MNAKMPELKRSFEAAGFTNVKTVLSSGNVYFDARSAREALLEQKAEAAMQAALGRTFHTIVRPLAALRSVLETDPYAAHSVAASAKRVVSFMRTRATANWRFRSNVMERKSWASPGGRYSPPTFRATKGRYS